MNRSTSDAARSSNVKPVDLLPRGVPAGTLAHVAVKNRARLHVLQAELAQVQLRQPGVGKDVATVVVEQGWLYLAYSWG